MCEEDRPAGGFTATCRHMLCSMANSGCLLVSNSGMLPHSLPCPPAFLYLQQVSHPLRGIIIFFFFLLSGSHVFLAGSLSLEGHGLTASSPAAGPRQPQPHGTGELRGGGGGSWSSAAAPSPSLRFLRYGGRGARRGLGSGLRRGQCGRQSRQRGADAFPTSALLPLGR